jgi:hypothetical protein
VFVFLLATIATQYRIAAEGSEADQRTHSDYPIDSESVQGLLKLVEENEHRVSFLIRKAVKEYLSSKR